MRSRRPAFSPGMVSHPERLGRCLQAASHATGSRVFGWTFWLPPILMSLIGYRYPPVVLERRRTRSHRQTPLPEILRSSETGDAGTSCPARMRRSQETTRVGWAVTPVNGVVTTRTVPGRRISIGTAVDGDDRRGASEERLMGLIPTILLDGRSLAHR